MMDEQARRRSRRRDGHAHPQPAIGRGSPQLRRDRPRIAEQPFESAQIKRDLARPQTSMRGENSRATASSAA